MIDRPGRAEAGSRLEGTRQKRAGRAADGDHARQARGQGRGRLGRRPIRRLRGPRKKLGLVWLSTWDSEDDAREFAQAYAPLPDRRMGKDAFQPEKIPDSLWRCLDDVCRVVERRGADVAVIEGFPPAATGALLEAAFRARKTEFSPHNPTPLDRKPAEK